MNGARTIFLRTGYWLTALAAIVLLAASPGTASAQTLTGFSQTSVSVTEGDNNTDVMVRKTGDVDTSHGEITVTVPTGLTVTAETATEGEINNGVLMFAENSDAVTLTIAAGADSPANWTDEQRNVSLASASGTIANAVLVVTVEDAEGEPVVTFAPSSITLFASNSATANMSVAPLDLLTAAEQDEVMVMVAPADALGEDGPIESLSAGGVAVTTLTGGMFEVPVSGLDVAAGLDLMITAKAAEDLATNATVTFSFVTLAATTGGTDALGTVMGGNELTVTFRGGDQGTEPDPEPSALLSGVEIELSAPRTVTEGGEATINVRATAMVAPTTTDNGGQAASNRTVAVNLGLAPGPALPGVTPGEFGTPGQVDDAGIVSTPRVSLTFAENTGAAPRERTTTGSITVRVNDDTDAESETVTVQPVVDDGVTVPPGITAPTVAGALFVIIDNETQTYVLALNPVTHTSTNPPKEGSDIAVLLAASPPHFQGGNTLTLQVNRGYSATGMGHASAGSVAIGTNDPTGGEALGTAVNRRAITITTPASDRNRVTDTITLEAHSGVAGRDSLAANIDIDVLDINMLPAASAITAVAKDKDGNEVTEIMEGGDPVFLTLTVDRGRGAGDRITDEELTVDIRAADAGQVADYDLSEARIVLESRSSGKQTNDIDLKIELSARDDEDVGMEYLMLNLEVSGDATIGTETSTGTFSIGIVDDTTPKVSSKSEADAYPKIRAALGDDPETSVMNPGQMGTIMASDLFTVEEGYTASYGVSVEGGAVSVSASSDSVTVTANAVGDSKVTVTATAKMAVSSFEASQTVSDVARITFPVTVVEAAEPVPALPLIAQWLLGLGLMGGGARQLYRRRQQQG